MATDISPGMLATLERSARELGERVETAAAEATELPFADGEFDLVFGHAVLHHLPDLDAAFREFRRVLRPGGVLAFCGEPSRYGDRIAALPKRGAHGGRAAVAGADGRRPRGRTATARARRRTGSSGWSTCTPSPPPGWPRAPAAAGFDEVRVSGEELAASLFGWVNRTLEASADPDDVPWAWRVYAYRGYLALQSLDRSLLEPRLPAALFYNLLLSARVPA